MASTFLGLSSIAAIDFVDLEIEARGAKDRRNYANPRPAFHHIANRVFAFGGPAIFHIDQHGRAIGRVRLGEKTADNARRVGSRRRSRRVTRRSHDPCAFLDHGRDKGRAGS